MEFLVVIGIQCIIFLVVYFIEKIKGISEHSQNEKVKKNTNVETTNIKKDKKVQNQFDEIDRRLKEFSKTTIFNSQMSPFLQAAIKKPNVAFLDALYYIHDSCVDTNSYELLSDYMVYSEHYVYTHPEQFLIAYHKRWYFVEILAAMYDVDILDDNLSTLMKNLKSAKPQTALYESSVLTILATCFGALGDLYYQGFSNASKKNSEITGGLLKLSEDVIPLLKDFRPITSREIKKLQNIVNQVKHA